MVRAAPLGVNAVEAWALLDALGVDLAPAGIELEVRLGEDGLWHSSRHLGAGEGPVLVKALPEVVQKVHSACVRIGALESSPAVQQLAWVSESARDAQKAIAGGDAPAAKVALTQAVANLEVLDRPDVVSCLPASILSQLRARVDQLQVEVAPLMAEWEQATSDYAALVAVLVSAMRANAKVFPGLAEMVSPSAGSTAWRIALDAISVEYTVENARVRNSLDDVQAQVVQGVKDAGLACFDLLAVGTFAAAVDVQALAAAWQLPSDTESWLKAAWLEHVQVVAQETGRKVRSMLTELVDDPGMYLIKANAIRYSRGQQLIKSRSSAWDEIQRSVHADISGEDTLAVLSPGMAAYYLASASPRLTLADAVLEGQAVRIESMGPDEQEIFEVAAALLSRSREGEPTHTVQGAWLGAGSALKTQKPSVSARRFTTRPKATTRAYGWKA